MHSDRELIELAAKAAGLHVKVASNSGMGLKVHGNCNWWNPLTDDGDALRLAVKLSFIDEGDWPQVTNEIYDHCGGDWFAATRRAIVRAAAAIGEAMQ